MKGKLFSLLVICFLIASASATVLMQERKTVEIKLIKNEIKPIIKENGEHLMAIEGKKIEDAFVRIANPANVPVANMPETEYHPALATSGSLYFASYTYSPSLMEQDIYMALSTDGGETFTPVGYWSIEGVEDYSTVDYWGGNTFYGSFTPDPSTPYQYLMVIQDINDINTWALYYWDWSSYGWYDFREPEIACYNSQNTWEYGVIATIASTTYEGYECVEAPHMFFASPDEEGTGYISWWPDYNNSAHASACIDKATNMIYCAYDWLNETAGSRNILVWVRSFDDPLAGSAMIEIPSDFNAICPTIAAYNDNILVVCQSDANGNQDLVCFYSNDGGNTWEMTTITSTPEDELYPDISLSGEKATVIFFKDGNLYFTYTEDWGATWSEPIKVNDADGSAMAEYRNAYIKGAGAVWTDNRNGNADIYFDTVGAVPIINVESVQGGFGVKATIANVGTADAKDVAWSIDLEGLVFIGKHKEGVISSLPAGQSTTISSGLVFGIGPVTVTVTAGGATATADGFIIGPFVLGL